MSKNVFLSGFVFLFIRSFLLRVSFEVILNNAVKNRVSDSRRHIFSASNTLGLFGLNKLSEACTTKPMVTGLNANRNVHDLETE
jgi:hypothetical protein